MKKISEIKEFISFYNIKKQELQNMKVPVPDSLSFSFYDYCDREQSYTAFGLVSECQNLTPELQQLKEIALASIKNFEDKLNPFIEEKIKFNQNIDDQIVELTNQLKYKVKQFPEIKLDSTININRRRFDNSELAFLKEVYKKLNFNFITESHFDRVFYNSKDIKFNEIKDLIIKTYQNTENHLDETVDKLNRYSHNSSSGFSPDYEHTFKYFINFIEKIE